MSTIITYNNKSHSIKDGHTATLECEGKKMLTDVQIESVGDSSVDLNIAYGNTAPEDTSKLWVKCEEPKNVQITANPVFANEELELDVASMSTAADGIAAASVGTKIYLFGGHYQIGTADYSHHYLNTISVFDTQTNAIETLTSVNLHTAASNIAAASVGTKIYLFGGYAGNNSNLSAIYIFDTESNTLTIANTVLDRGIHSIAAASVGTKIYLFGGRYNSSTNSSSVHSMTCVFDTETQNITTLTSSQVNGYGIASAVIGTKIYLFGGESSYTNYIRLFNTEDYTLSTISESLPAGSSIATSVMGHKVYLFGGYAGSTTTYRSNINIYDTENDTITAVSTSLPIAAGGIASATVDKSVYLFGGKHHTEYALSSINKFIVQMPLTTNNLLIETTIAKNTFNLISGSLLNVQAGINNVYLGNSEGLAEKVPAVLYKDGAWAEI